MRLADPQGHRSRPHFISVDDLDDVPADATPFDIRGVELGHKDGGCSFETVLLNGGRGARTHKSLRSTAFKTVRVQSANPTSDNEKLTKAALEFF